jgi:tetratricopeptide (TPR) repeat protein
VLGPEHPDTATGLDHLAFLLQAQGDLAEARPLYERALATATGLSYLALLLVAQGDLAGARPLSERALAMYEKVLGPEHPNTATSLNNLANLLRDQGDLTGARPLYERALAIREKVLGPEHPDTARSLNNLLPEISCLGLPPPAPKRDADGGLAFGGEMKPSRSGHRQTSHLGDNDAKPTVT